MLELIPALVDGVVLGTLFFLGLWWTVGRAVASPAPAAWLIGSQLLRTVLLLTGWYCIAHGEAGRLLFCLLGFVLARQLVTWSTRDRVSPRGAP